MIRVTLEFESGWYTFLQNNSIFRDYNPTLIKVEVIHEDGKNE